MLKANLPFDSLQALRCQPQGTGTSLRRQNDVGKSGQHLIGTILDEACKALIFSQFTGLLLMIRGSGAAWESIHNVEMVPHPDRAAPVERFRIDATQRDEREHRIRPCTGRLSSRTAPPRAC